MIVEVMLAFSLMILFTVSTYIAVSSLYDLNVWSVDMLEKLEISVQEADGIITDGFQYLAGKETSSYGNDTIQVSVEPFVLNHSDFREAWGRNSCATRFDFDPNRISYFPGGVDIGVGNASTDLEVRNEIIYLSADSSASASHDFFIIDARKTSYPVIVSSLNTGPGIFALEVAGPYVFAAQASSVNQLQIIDIRDRSLPQLISQIRLPLPTPTTTAPFATSIFYSKEFVYIGTAKWNGSEFAIVDVSNPYDPIVVGGFETGTQINDIYVRGDKAYLATSDIQQMRVLDVSDKGNPILITSFTYSGWQTQAGKVFDFFVDRLGFGRTVGGFNVVSNHEAFLFDINASFDFASTSSDVPGGVYGILIRPEFIFLATHSQDREFQVWDTSFSQNIFNMPLGINPVRMLCDDKSFYLATGNSDGFSLIKTQ